VSKDILQSECYPESALVPPSVQAELHRTRALLRELLECLMDDGYELYRDGPMSEWWNEDARRTKVLA
jgi:hypothetical protein